MDFSLNIVWCSRSVAYRTGKSVAVPTSVTTQPRRSRDRIALTHSKRQKVLTDILRIRSLSDLILRLWKPRGNKNSKIRSQPTG